MSVRIKREIHGATGTRLYHIWANMKRRCSDPTNIYCKGYADRGIKVCEEWQSFTVFRNWSLETGYSESLSIDRINNDQDYTPGNCHWATPKEQANNRRSSKLITIDDETKTLAQWIDDSGIKSSTVRQRIYAYKWPIELALGRN